MNFFKSAEKAISKAGNDVKSSVKNIFADKRGKLSGSVTDDILPVGSQFFGEKASDYKLDKFQGVDGRTLYLKDTFFRFPSLSAKDHNLNYGYEFVIHDKASGQIVNRLRLPLNPQNITVNVPSAVTTETTMKGIVETHNGAPLRQISLSGTSGIIPAPILSASSKADSSELQKTIEYAFKNTISAVNRSISAVNRTAEAFSAGNKKIDSPLNFSNFELADNNTITGYRFIHELTRFLDFYLAAKKLKENKSWRLYFYMYKDQMYYACTLNGYSIQKPPGSVEYNYNINLTAWRREEQPVSGVSRTKKSSLTVSKDSLSQLNRAINGIREARRALATFHGVMAGIRNDISESFIQPVGEATLLMADAVNLTTSVYDFAFNGDLSRSLEASWRKHVTENADALRVAMENAGDRFKQAIGINKEAKTTSGLISYAVTGENKGVADLNQVEDSADPVKNLFENAPDYPAVFEAVSLDELSLSKEVQTKIDDELNRVRSLTADDIREKRDKVADFAASVSEAFGGGSVTYNRINGLGTPKKTYTKLTVENIEILRNFNEIVMQMDSLIRVLESNTDQLTEDYYTFYSDYAISNGIPFDSSNASKFFVPFPYGASLEMLAAQYLGDADRWIEIAALNALKAPYIDEEGYEIPVTASSGGNTLTVGEAPNLYIGQVVLIKSDTEKQIKKKIRSIDTVSSIETIVTFEESGSGSLSIYKPRDNAKIIAFMPNTVNSNMLIAIPTAAPATVKSLIKTTPGVEDLNGMAQIAMQDILLDLDGDIIFTGGGDLKTAEGVTNLIQAAMLKIKTKAGALLQHPDYGNSVEPGTPTSEIDADQILESLKTAFAEDSRFSGILAAEIEKVGVTMNIKILVGLSNTDVTLPLSAQIPL